MSAGFSFLLEASDGYQCSDAHTHTHTYTHTHTHTHVMYTYTHQLPCNPEPSKVLATLSHGGK
jgi:hypothetical protein